MQVSRAIDRACLLIRERTIRGCRIVSGVTVARAASHVGQAVTPGCGAHWRWQTRAAARNDQGSDGSIDRSVRDVVLAG